MYGESAITDSAKVREAFNDLNIMTFFGPLKIDPATGKQLGHPMLLMQWQGNSRVIIYPAEYAEAQPLIGADNWQFGAAPTTTTTTQTGGGAATTTETAETTTTTAGGVSTGLVAAIIILIIIVAVAAFFLTKK